MGFLLFRHAGDAFGLRQIGARDGVVAAKRDFGARYSLCGRQRFFPRYSESGAARSPTAEFHTDFATDSGKTRAGVDD